MIATVVVAVVAGFWAGVVGAVVRDRWRARRARGVDDGGPALVDVAGTRPAPFDRDEFHAVSMPDRLWGLVPKNWSWRGGGVRGGRPMSSTRATDADVYRDPHEPRPTIEERAREPFGHDLDGKRRGD